MNLFLHADLLTMYTDIAPFVHRQTKHSVDNIHNGSKDGVQCQPLGWLQLKYTKHREGRLGSTQQSSN